MVVETVKGEPNGGREGWLTLRQLREAGYLSPEQLAKGEPPEVGDVGGKVVEVCRKMEIAIMETALAKNECLEELPFGPKHYDEFNRNRTACRALAAEFIDRVLVHANTPADLRVSVEALATMVEQGYLVHPGREAAKSWAVEAGRPGEDGPHRGSRPGRR